VPEPARRLRRLGGYVRSSRDLRERTTAKDITAAAPTPAAIAGAAVDNRPDADDDNATPDPARCATPDGNGTNKNAAATTPRRPRTARSNPAAGTDERNNPHDLPLGAGPRTPPPPALRPAHRPPAPPAPAVPTAWARESADDNAAIAPDGNAGPPRSNARFGSLDNVANAAPPGGTTRCSNDSGDGRDDRTARSL